MAKPDLDARVITLAANIRLAGVDVYNERLPESARVSNGVAQRRDYPVRPISLERLRITYNGVPRIEMKTYPPEGVRHDSRDLRIHAA